MKHSALVMLSALVLLLGGCAQAILPSGPGTAGGPGLTALTVTPPSATIPGVTQQQFTAKTGDGSKPSVLWSINGIAGGNASIGTIAANGMYTAPEFPPTANSITISAVETSNSKMLGNASATLNNPVPQLTSLLPLSVGQGPFTLTLSGLHFAQGAVAYMGNVALATTYVSSTQLMAAGSATAAQAGTQIITVHNPDPGASNSAGVNLIVKGGVAVLVAPATAMVRTGNTQAFTVMVTGALDPSITWTVNGKAGGDSTIGTVAANGLYTAPQVLPTPNTVTVTVTSVEDPTKSSSSTITLENAIPVITSVTPTALTANMAFELTINGTGFTPGSIVNLGTVALSTTFIAPTQLIAVGTPTLAQVGTVPVTVVNPNPGGSTSAPVNVQVVGPNSNITVTISPKTATLGAGNVQQFVATVTGSIDLSVTWSVNGVSFGNSAAGRIDFEGNYAAPNNIVGLGSVTVTATSNANSAKSDSATVTLTNPVPTLASITPSTVGLGSFQITLNGTGFVSTSTATFGGQPLQVTYVTPTMITAIGNALNTQVGTVPVIVTNPAPGGGTSNSVNVTVTTAGTPESSAAAVRFLEQASFGPGTENVNQVTEIGFDKYLQNQFASAVTTYPNPRTNDSINNVQQSFFLNAIAGGDQLRLRTGFALNELWVVSANTVNDPLGYTNYLRALDKDALGNYLDVMTDVTLTPAMGTFLNMVNNDAPPPGEHANENYAREIMQLFTLGLNQLNPDGTPVVDSSGNPIPTYAQSDVMDLGRAFTGWTYPVTPGKPSQNHNPQYYGGPMIAVGSLHDSGQKTILGQAIPAGQSAEQDLASALGIIFNHPNVGPFVAKQMIEHLVTSNPSPAYVQRVATAFNTGTFNSYGSGKRGDMQAMIAAILLDPEARRGDNLSTVVVTDGKLREPVVLIASIARAFHAKTDAGGLSNWSANMSQDIFNPSTVFNFFPPVNPIAGTSLNGPEFAIFDTNTSLARMNFINATAYQALGQFTTLDFSPVITAGTTDQMVSWLDALFLHSSTPTQMKQTILTALAALDPADTTGQAKAAIYLYLSSSMYQTQH
ncbi:MAG TPA: DUF1800 family protein [Candidatus Acidoferrales bacterium]|nr:DUF1800 family protein [Candidatus Acidoferrales bacterium]